MRAEDAIRIRHMLDAAELARDFVVGRARTDLDQDKMLRYALVRAIQVIGEAASKVSPESRLELPGVPWAAITGMRNRLVHAYFDIDTNLLWVTVEKDLPDLLTQLKAVDLPD
jgi:uncharacterized protein with HEPN domain